MKRLMTFKRHKYAKQTQEESAQAQYLLILSYSSNHNILKFWSRSDEQDLKNLEKLISDQKLLWISKQHYLLLILKWF